MSAVTVAWRLLRVLEHLLTGAILTLVMAATRARGEIVPWQAAIVRWWHGRLCRSLGVRLIVHGAPERGVLLIANHVSWLDIPVLGAQGPIAFLAKAEVRSWPLIGWMAAVAGTFFIARGAHQAEALRAPLRARILAGYPVTIFAEGTTSDGRSVRHFHPRLFAVAGAEGTKPSLPIQPVALRYGTNAAPDPHAPFIADDRLVPHLWRILRHPGLEVRVTFLPAIASAGRSRRELAEATREAIVRALDCATAVPPRARTPRDRLLRVPAARAA